ncbi:MAG: hypothetical protein ACRENP_11895 [Longimicrobiales bacterium]
MDGRKQQYEEWLGAVDSCVQDQLSVGIDDLPDCAYLDAFEAGVSARACAEDVIEEVRDA